MWILPKGFFFNDLCITLTIGAGSLMKVVAAASQHRVGVILPGLLSGWYFHVICPAVLLGNQLPTYDPINRVYNSLVVYKNTCASIPYLFLIYPMYLCSLYPKFSGAVCKLGEKGPLAVLWRRTSRVHAMPRKSLILLLDWQPTTPSTLYKWNPAPSLWSHLATTHAQPPSEDGEK